MIFYNLQYCDKRIVTTKQKTSYMIMFVCTTIPQKFQICFYFWVTYRMSFVSYRIEEYQREEIT